MSTPSTLPPRDVAIAMIEHGVAKHQTRYDKVFFKAVLAGAFLSTGGLLLEIIEGGDNPGLVKILGGGVFPVGLVILILRFLNRIVLTGQELLTSNMMVFPMAWMKGAIPWWSTFVNWIIDTGVISTAPYEQFVMDFAIFVERKPGPRSGIRSSCEGSHVIGWSALLSGKLQGLGRPFQRLLRFGFPFGSSLHADMIMSSVCQLIVHTGIKVSQDDLANMFLVPVGILFGAPLTVAQYIRKSLIAAFLGNVVGALCVAVPAVYFYLSDYDYRLDSRQLRNVEEGEALNEIVQDVGTDKIKSSGSSGNVSNAKRES
ncbi:hypothetical protein A7U60_g3091 [Sanghuangporus baumii]|uniref:Uncharacterized protein n=1 Tax=Sanghuangporus baumii TaxID=108892 RepID=A0A9Q5I139_SANBA|nr:hypothetical protein A7U60_g3091 [Sanghuangporus baumii]